MGITISLIIVTILCVYLLWTNALMALKIGYYEQTLKNNRDKFTKERWKKIVEMLNRKSLKL